MSVYYNCCTFSSLANEQGKKHYALLWLILWNKVQTLKNEEPLTHRTAVFMLGAFIQNFIFVCLRA